MFVNILKKFDGKYLFLGVWIVIVCLKLNNDVIWILKYNVFIGLNESLLRVKVINFKLYK